MKHIIDPDVYQRCILLNNGCYILQAVEAQGGDYDIFLPTDEYIGSRPTEYAACIHAYVTARRCKWPGETVVSSPEHVETPVNELHA